MTEDEAPNYLTVGQLADEVGVTVRTIQYYDQQKLLSPSAKGANNQRYYSAYDKEHLYRILSLKYLGLSLSDIRQLQEGFDDSEEFRALITTTLESLEDDFQALIKRLSILRSLLEESASSPMTNWERVVQTIEVGQADDKYFWNMIEADKDAAPNPPEPAKSRARGAAVGAWHELIADTIALISAGKTPEGEEGQQLARRYVDLRDKQGVSLEDSFLLMENISPHRGAKGSFDALRKRVSEFLDCAACALADNS